MQHLGLIDFLNRHPAMAASNIESFPPNHRACAIALYDSVELYDFKVEYTGSVLVFEAMAEPARSCMRVAERWLRIADDLTVIPIQGTHMSIMIRPDVIPLARELSQLMHSISQQQIVDHAAALRQHVGPGHRQHGSRHGFSPD
jgi:hypothetical protein